MQWNTGFLAIAMKKQCQNLTRKGDHLGKISQYLKDKEAIQAILGQIEPGKKQLLTGLEASGKTVIFQTLFEALDKAILIVTHNVNQANELLADLTGLLEEDQLFHFPADASIQMELAVSSPEIHAERVNFLTALLDNKRGIYVTSLAGVKRFLPDPKVFKAAGFQFKVGEDIELEDLNQRLVANGYVRENLVAAPGEFSIRGGIVDMYPLTEDYPIRLELFDTEIDSLRYFDPESQRSLEQISEIAVQPVTEQIMKADWKAEALDRLSKKVAEESEKIQDPEKLENFQAKMQLLLDDLAGDGEGDTLSLYASEIYPEEISLLDYLGEDGVLILDEYPRMMTNHRQDLEEESQWVEDQVTNGGILAGVQFSIDLQDALQALNQPTIYTALFEKGLGQLKLNHLHHFRYRSMQEFFGQLEILHAEMNRYRKQDFAVMVAAPNQERASKIQETLADYEIQAALADDTRPISKEELTIQIGSLHNGFELAEEKLAVITERELFNRLPKKRPKRLKVSNAERLKSYNELKPGDYVVHINHGIGRFTGMETLEIKGVHQDYLQIEYQKGSKLHVPASQLHLVQKYVGSDDKQPKIHKLGGSDWQKTKQRVSQQVEDIADELIDLYASREAEKGFAFSEDSTMQRDFEEAFPYTETPDQLRSAAEIKKDMEKEQPMDRLLVGDVGYGKTEVAMRAIFKAIQDGKQAAFLVPTTVLAQQHYETLQDRMEEFAVNVALMSRFRTPKQQAETLAGLKRGTVDVVVGTHRILSQDVEFADLGLLIVDEEQRFGVKAKERLKRLKKDVDVLTLTATPIPRTLHMSMVGVRDLSVIETPPQNRFPVQTYVMEEHAGAIREAIERELERDGQVFYLHNRVGSIVQKANEIQALVPQASVAYIHGQMTEHEIEDSLYRFVEREIDVLVTTTIIETGVDIPNANTLIVEDADRMGLSQLYQLRGRVGRTNRVAYAYFLYKPHKILKEESVKRLQTLREFTALGSGFKIAMRDLSIRGAGNLLGKQQSGFIDSVGYDLYTELLQEAVQRKQKGKKAVKTTVEINLDIDAYLPDFYIADEGQKIEIYKRIRQLEDEDQYRDLQDDLIDRFGDYPQEVADLLAIGLIKMYAETAQVEEINEDKQRRQHLVKVHFSKQASQEIPAPEIFRALEHIPVKVDVDMTEGAYVVSFKFPLDLYDDMKLDYLLKFLRNIAQYSQETGEEEVHV